MKKLLFLTSVLTLSLLISCGNRKEAKKVSDPIVENGSAKSESIADSAQAKDGGVVIDSVASKEKSGIVDRKEAPKPGTPDQQKLDSIKAAKAKEKNK